MALGAIQVARHQESKGSETGIQQSLFPGTVKSLLCVEALGPEAHTRRNWWTLQPVIVDIIGHG